MEYRKTWRQSGSNADWLKGYQQPGLYENSSKHTLYECYTNLSRAFDLIKSIHSASLAMASSYNMTTKWTPLRLFSCFRLLVSDLLFSNDTISFGGLLANPARIKTCSWWWLLLTWTEALWDSSAITTPQDKGAGNSHLQTVAWYPAKRYRDSIFEWFLLN